ncbi:hypothetical protein ASPFODRAFT_29640 [Aspergillus luchuensis CBS 106.47]|uniref:Uncharacterized protein n=1 Tax=Aspergillus luchuensis (strain CBS 106.47) TaxID=1137211 RepID=A0A1M3TWU5_ASPLC|nr:hypothetical protein ASPFODRAFT_29640 [Aspergillus luchuensis CBS 106.47]
MSTILSALSLFISLWVMGFLGTWDCTSLDGSTQLLTEVKGFLLWNELIAYLVMLVVVALELHGAWSSVEPRGAAFWWSWSLSDSPGSSPLLGPGTTFLLINN